MKYKNLLFNSTYIFSFIFVLTSFIGCKTDHENSIYQNNFEKYTTLFFSDIEVDKKCNQFILLPKIGCGFCISVTEKFIKTQEISNLLVFTNQDKEYGKNNILKESKDQESILSNINLKTQKGPALIQFKDQKMVYIEAINSDNYSDVFKKIHNFSARCY